MLTPNAVGEKFRVPTLSARPVHIFRHLAEALRSFRWRAVCAPLAAHLLALFESGAKPDVAVAVRTIIVQVQREHTGARAIVPVAAAIRETLNINL